MVFVWLEPARKNNKKEPFEPDSASHLQSSLRRDQVLFCAIVTNSVNDGMDSCSHSGFVFRYKKKKTADGLCSVHTRQINLCVCPQEVLMSEIFVHSQTDI